MLERHVREDEVGRALSQVIFQEQFKAALELADWEAGAGRDMVVLGGRPVHGFCVPH